MAAKPLRLVDVPDADLVAAVEGSTSFGVAAKKLGVPRTTLQGILDRRGLKCRPRPEMAEVIPDEITDAEVYEERIRDLERAAFTYRRDDVRLEKALRRIEQAAQELKPRYSPKKFDKPVSGGDEHEFALLFSDTHAAEVVNFDETLGMNAYNWEIMLQRMERLRDSLLSYQAHRPYPVRTLHLMMLGDMLSGDIHQELSETNEMNAAEAVVQFATDTALWIESLVPHFEKIRVVGVPGNHPRARQKPQAKNAHNNGDWLAYHMMRMKLNAYESVEWDIPVGSFESVVVAERWRVLCMHGDGIRSSMPGVPWGGVIRRVTTLQQQFESARQPIDYVVMGHFHNVAAIEGVGTKTIINGSVKGVDEYSLKAFGSGRAPSQVLLTFHRERGLTDISIVDLEATLPACLRTPLPT